jgi:hypothetical protein
MKAEIIAKALGGRRSGGCPAHDDHEPSLAITDTRDGKVLVRCHAGCGQRDVIAALRAHGAWDRERGAVRQPPPARNCDAAIRMEAALTVWRASRSAEGTPVETYLRSRGLTISVPISIRFHAGLKHPLGGMWPVLVALVTRGIDGKPIGIHRTFLARDGIGKAPVDPVRMMLGPCRRHSHLGLRPEVIQSAPLQSFPKRKARAPARATRANFPTKLGFLNVFS